MIHLTLSGTGGDAYFPNKICFTRGRETYVRFVASKGVPSNPDVTLTVKYGVTTVELKRTVAGKGASVVFPLAAILEPLRPADGEPYFVDVFLTVTFGSGTATHALDVVHVGTCDREVLPLSAQDAAGGLTNYPFARRIAVYPAFPATQYLYVPTLTTERVRVETDEGEILTTYGGATPFAEIYPADFRWSGEQMLYISVYGETLVSTLPYPVLVDRCTAGVFLRWVDMSGMPYLYRWTQEAETHSVEAEATYTRLDDTLNPYEIQTKTLERRYTLHSRIVERDLYEMCRTILAAQEIWMYDAGARSWTRCYIDEAEAEDNGAEMQDLIIEVVKREYNL